ncbi:L,D-transpeptidase family protein [Hymenobacter terricola]|uniref:L,D-transpeptidase family protein n=1 Tax=Hymenobacter terricola TaxID=2819236 RepID=UPI001B304ED4|nr:L,D-transpeptidase family protein [Hymenobacter terricola]
MRSALLPLFGVLLLLTAASSGPKAGQTASPQHRARSRQPGADWLAAHIQAWLADTAGAPRRQLLAEGPAARAFYARRAYAPAWSAGSRPSPTGRAALAQAAGFGLLHARYHAQNRPVDPDAVSWRAVTARHFPYTIRQNSGCDNALGNIIFRFANPYSVYLHATSNTKDFQRPYRALGHGCLRMEHPMQLAAYLLGADSTQATLPTEAECEASPRSRSLALKHPLPLHVCYAACAVAAGQLRFYPDVYGRDEAVRRQLFGR